MRILIYNEEVVCSNENEDEVYIDNNTSASSSNKHLCSI